MRRRNNTGFTWAKVKRLARLGLEQVWWQHERRVVLYWFGPDGVRVDQRSIKLEPAPPDLLQPLNRVNIKGSGGWNGWEGLWG
jgi:hypothetical protein